jgi:hypothetical protein
MSGVPPARDQPGGRSGSRSPLRKRKGSSEGCSSRRDSRDEPIHSPRSGGCSPRQSQRFDDSASVPDVPTTSAEPEVFASEASSSSSLFHTSSVISEQARRQVASTASNVSLEKLGFSWDQTEQDVRIYLPLTTATTEQLECTFTDTSAHLSAVVGTQRFFFELRRLYAPIDPASSLGRVPRSRKHVVLKLRKKQQNLEWPLLRKLDDHLI